MSTKIVEREAIIDFSVDDNLSSPVPIEDDVIIGLLIPTMDAGTVTFKVSNEEEGIYYDVWSTDGTGIFTIASSSGGIAIWLDVLATYKFVKVATGTAQTADRTFTFLVKKQ
jgi:hypothetical protein